MTPLATPERITLAAARAEAAASALRKGAGYCAMRHPTDRGSCTRIPEHSDHHRDWYKRATPLGPYLDWTDREYA